MAGSADGLHVGIVGELTGGVGVYGQNLIRGLAALGVRLTLITPTPERAEACRIVAARGAGGRGRWVPQALAFARALAPIRRELDLVHFTDARYALFTARGAQPVVGTMNDYFYAITGWLRARGTRAVYRDWLLRHLYYNLVRLGEGRTLRRLDRVVCISRAVGDTLVGRYGVAARQLALVPYGIAAPPPPPAAPPPPDPVVLFAGGNFQRKGLDLLLLAAPEVLAARPDARFVVLGSSPDEGLMKGLCARLGVQHAFRFVGQVDRETLYAHYRNAAVFTMPSKLEAFGMPYLEAMSCDLPVVASDVAGPDDFLVSGRNALVVPAGDFEALARAIVRLLSDRDLRRALVAGGRETAALLTVERMAEATLQVYRAAVAAR
jgi:glycosyltransferase involved in cell wall biosynthesis